MTSYRQVRSSPHSRAVWGHSLSKTKSPSAFQSKYAGKCRECQGSYPKGAQVVSPGKGLGAYHISCWSKVLHKAAGK